VVSVRRSDRAGKNRHTLPCGDWATYEAALDPIIERLRGVVIENKDAIEIIRTHDGAKTLHYVDPPYVSSTRDRGADYRHEMDDAAHVALADFLKSLSGFVILSGYASPLYDSLYENWRRHEREALADGARKRLEVLWISPNCPKEVDLFT
jgi:DNA adenine methylase